MKLAKRLVLGSFALSLGLGNMQAIAKPHISVGEQILIAMGITTLAPTLIPLAPFFTTFGPPVTLAAILEGEKWEEQDTAAVRKGESTRHISTLARASEMSDEEFIAILQGALEDHDRSHE